MKKTNKKGFTIVELVIVIAVIAILAAVLIPTFTNVVKKANDSACLQAMRNEMTEAEAEFWSDGVLENYVKDANASETGDQPAGDYYVEAGKAFNFYVKDGKITVKQAGTKYTAEQVNYAIGVLGLTLYTE